MGPAPQNMMRRAAVAGCGERFQAAQNEAQREADGGPMCGRSRAFRFQLVHGPGIEPDQSGARTPGFAKKRIVRFEGGVPLQRADALPQAVESRTVRGRRLRSGRKKRPDLQS